MLYRRLRGGSLPTVSLVVVVAACGGGSAADAPSGESTEAAPNNRATPSPATKPGAPGAASSGDASDPRPDASTADASDAPSGPDANDPATIASASCAAALPPNGARAAALPLYGGACPTLAAAPAFTTITTSGGARTFIVFRPAAIAPGERLPVVFLWHWLGGSPEQMGTELAVQAAVEARRFIGIVPAPKGDALLRWPFEASQPQARVDEEALFFDDVLACVSAALPVNKECVSSVGVSAGALWTAQLAIVRSPRLSSLVSLSGGVGGVARSWSTTPHRLPSLVLWGGASDTYPSNLPIMNFQNASKSLIGELSKDGHAIVECTHNCGHAVPPFDLPAAPGLVFDPVWRFVLDHPYWLAASKSPYTGKPLPTAYPSWCGQGQGSATPRPSGAACP